MCTKGHQRRRERIVLLPPGCGRLTQAMKFEQKTGKRTECARPRAQQRGTVDGHRFHSEPQLDRSWLRPGRPHSEKSSRRTKIFRDRNTKKDGLILKVERRSDFSPLQ